MKDKICMVTGANAGIGYETAKGLAAAGATVILVCRSQSRGAEALEEIQVETGNERLELFVCDLGSQAAIRTLVADFKTRFHSLHVLINNAAIYTTERTETDEGIETQLAVNHLAPFALTNLLLDTLKASAPARVINLSTSNHFDVSLDLEDLQARKSYTPIEVHMRTKLANILFIYELASRLEGTGVTANCLHPGVIATKLLGQVRNVPPDDRFTPVMGGDPLEGGGRTSLFLATSRDVQDVSGKYFDEWEAVRSSRESYDRVKARRLWRISEALTGLGSG